MATAAATSDDVVLYGGEQCMPLSGAPHENLRANTENALTHCVLSCEQL